MGKAYRNLSSLLLFSLFLLAGFVLGRAVFNPSEENWAGDFISSLRISTSIKSLPEVANGQRNILVIGVDNLNTPQPRLESVWLILYIIDRPQVTLFPIYPAPSAEILGPLFKITPEGAPDPVFLEALLAQGLWWSSYILLDEAAMAEVVEAASSLSAKNRNSISGVRAVAEVPPVWEDPDGSLIGQISLAQTICRQLNGSPSRLDISYLLDLIPRHASTDLNLTRAAAELESLLSDPDGLSCEFPNIRIGSDRSP